MCVCVQVVCRHLVKSALLVSHLSSSSNTSGSGRPNTGANTGTYFPASADGAIIHFPLRPPSSPSKQQRLLRATLATFERTGDRLSEACIALLTRCNGEHFENNLGVTRRTLNMLAEAGVACGLLGLTRQGGVLVAALCRFSVPPSWHWQAQDWLGGAGAGTGGGGEGGGEGEAGAGDRDSLLLSAPPPPPPSLKRRHLQSFARLTQVEGIG